MRGFRRRLSHLAVKAWATGGRVAMSGPPVASFTFDDAIDTAYSRGAPMLERHGARGTFYIAAGYLGATASDRRFTTGAEVVDLHRRGHEIACHTYSHPRVATLDAAALAAEGERNRATLAALDPTIRLENFAYPYNATSLRAKRVLAARFASCRGGVPGVNAGRVDPGYLRAVELCDELTDAARVRAWVAEAARRRGWLVFLTHGVTDERQAWRSTPALLEGAIEATRAAGLAIVTVRDAMRRLEGGAG